MEPRRRFKFIRELAQGGFGKVYLAEMITGENFSTVVAIKLLHGRWLGNDEIVMRSRDEARLLGKLRHRNIVRVEDLSSINGQCAIVMEYLRGVDLKQIANWLKERNRIFPRRALCEAIGGVATALEAAWSATPVGATKPLSVIHRDIKPSNAMVTVEGELKVLDFGTARATFEEREAKTQVLAFGSQAYMSPERMLGEADTPAADIFSLGVTLYELLALESYGKIHLREERYTPNLTEKSDALQLGDLPPELAAELREALRAMMAYEPTMRPSASDVMEMMETLGDKIQDAGLKKFARETVKEIIDAVRPPDDPHDPCVGQLLFEDTSSIHDPTGQATGVLPPPSSLSDEEKLIDLPGSKPAATVDGPAAYAAPPTPPRVATASPSFGADGPGLGMRVEPTVSGARPRVGPSPSGEVTTGTLVLGQEPEPKPSSGGGFVKVFLALVVLGVLGTVGAGAAWYFVFRTPSVSPMEIGNTTAPTEGAVSGSPDLDWATNAAGKGGVILQVPGGATEVVVTRAGGYRTVWDGQYNLRLKDLDPGPYRAKVKATGAAGAALSDFIVEPGKTCVLSYTRGSWEKGECR